jgi:hypothetical protein
MTPEQEKYIRESVPARYTPLFLRAFEGNSRTAAIKAHCLTCVGFTPKEIRGCTVWRCPMHPYRPYQREDEAEE